MTDKTPEALATLIEKLVPEWPSVGQAAALLRRQHQRIAELEEALKDAKAAIHADLNPALQWPFNIRALKKKALENIDSALLSTAQQEDSQA